MQFTTNRGEHMRQAHKANKPTLVMPVHVEVVTWLSWFQRGVFLTVIKGQENIYGTDMFGYEYYAKVD